eukprot:COSAG05_NODE_1708_length_4240_cov_2505.441439_3_plen_437_part_00
MHVLFDGESESHKYDRKSISSGKLTLVPPNANGGHDREGFLAIIEDSMAMPPPPRNTPLTATAVGPGAAGLFGEGGSGNHAAPAADETLALRGSSDRESMSGMAGFVGSGEIADILEIKKIEYIAKGTTGAVYKARWNGMTVAAKFFTCIDDKEVYRAFDTELILMRKLNHVNLLRVFGACLDARNPCLVTELMAGSLDQLLWGAQKDNNPVLSPRQMLKIAHGVATGCAFLHKNQVCHRDLKSPNVLYNAQLQVKLCDFAFSKWKAEASRNFSSSVGTPAWMAPEVLRGGQYLHRLGVYHAIIVPTCVSGVYLRFFCAQICMIKPIHRSRYGFSADLWGYGVILWEMLARCRPFADLNEFAIAYQVSTQGLTLTPPANARAFWAELMEQCWAANPAQRPSFATIVKRLEMAATELSAQQLPFSKVVEPRTSKPDG